MWFASKPRKVPNQSSKSGNQALFFLCRALRMSFTKPLMAGMLLGGTVIATLGAASHYVSEKKLPSRKGLVRDFIIGAVMVAMIMQLLPESSTSIIKSFIGIMPMLPAMPAALSFLGGGTSTEEQSETQVENHGNSSNSNSNSNSNSKDEMEVHVGVPRF